MGLGPGSGAEGAHLLGEHLADAGRLVADLLLDRLAHRLVFLDLDLTKSRLAN